MTQHSLASSHPWNSESGDKHSRILQGLGRRGGSSFLHCFGGIGGRSPLARDVLAQLALYGMFSG